MSYSAGGSASPALAAALKDAETRAAGPVVGDEEEDVPIDNRFGRKNSIAVNKAHLRHVHEHARPSHNAPAGSAHAANVASDAAERADPQHHHHVHFTEDDDE